MKSLLKVLDLRRVWGSAGVGFFFQMWAKIHKNFRVGAGRVEHPSCFAADPIQRLPSAASRRLDFHVLAASCPLLMLLVPPPLTLCVVFGVRDGCGVKLQHDALQMTLTVLAYLVPEASVAATPVLFSDL